ncbi:MAG: hypothetical protein IJU69_05765 [Bacteroidales bacterium]|nr:hypothetical protein [Bacteroidales bacterium]
MKRFIPVAFLFSLLCGCVAPLEDAAASRPVAEKRQVVNVITGMDAVLKRAEQMARIKWTPLLDVPNNSGFFAADKTCSGIPYSSAKEFDKMVGIEVSFVTFMTAVHNPRSVLYSEDIGDGAYNGTNCASYYGTVCSSAVDYAFGFTAPFWTSTLQYMDCFTNQGAPSYDKLKPCDVLWRPGHVVMVYSVNTAADGKQSVTIFESGGPTTYIYTLARDDFEQKWVSEDNLIYRFNDFDSVPAYSALPFAGIDGNETDQYRYNDAICTDRGDFVVYRCGESVKINILDNSFQTISLRKDGELFIYRIITSEDEEFKDLPAGRYKAYLSSQGSRDSEPVEFDVVDTQVEAHATAVGFDVRFSSSNARAEYVLLCSKSGGRKFIHILTPEEIASGYANVKYSGRGDIYCKVFFATSFGKVSNEPIKIQ